MTLPTAPPPLPIDSSLLDATPEHDRLRTEEPVRRVTLREGNHPWLITRYEDARAVLADPRFSADSAREGFPGLREKTPPRSPGHFHVMDPPDHTRLRRMLIPEFSFRRIEGLRGALQRICERLIDDMTADGATGTDLVEAYALPLPTLAICELLGVPYEDHAFFQARYRVVTSLVADPAEAAAARADLYGYLGDLLVRRAREPADDLMSRLATERVATGELTSAEAVGMVSLLLAAGHDTTANMIPLAVLALVREPARLAALHSDPARWPDAVEELLRRLTVVRSGLRRIATEDVSVGGVLIRAGEGVIVALHTANHDPEAFGSPGAPDSRPHLAFGHGPHQCIGQSLARVELQAGLSTLFRRIPDLRLAAPLEGLALSTSAVHGVRTLPVTW